MLPRKERKPWDVVEGPARERDTLWMLPREERKPCKEEYVWMLRRD